MEVHRFEARLEPVGERGNATRIRLPPEIARALGGRARFPVVLRVGGVEYRGSTMPLGDGTHCVGIPKAIRDAAGVAEGDTFPLEIARDDSPREVDVPPELAAALDAEPGLREAFDTLSYTQRKEHARDVASAMRPETRERRLAKVLAAVRYRR